MAPPTADILTSRDAGIPKAMREADGVPRTKAGSGTTRPSLAAFRKGIPKPELPPKEAAAKIATAWLADFQQALDSKNMDRVMDLFHEDAWWKDLLTFEWDHHAKKDKPVIRKWLEEDNKLWNRNVKNLKLDPASAAPLEALPGVVWIMAFFDFETNITRGRGCVRLQQMPNNGPWKAYLFFMGIEEIIGHEEKRGITRPQGVNHGENLSRRSWHLNRAKHILYEDGHEPEVLVIGAGQAGLTIAARLGQLEVDTLIIERNERVGDNWRKRYDFLVLHDPSHYSGLAYVPFPEHWPIYTPSRKLANWLESYAETMELNVWTGATLTSSSYDKATKKWTVHITKSDGTQRELHPGFVVLATGHSGEPNMPKFKGAENFKGTLCHSSQHTAGRDFSGKHAVVIGACNSSNDLSHDFYEQGAHITMVQRSATYVMSSSPGVTDILFRDIYNEKGPPLEDCDLIFNSIPNPVHLQQMAGVTAEIADADKEILDGLEKAGFKLAWGPQEAGFLPLYFSRGGGYYLDVGASPLIAQGKIKIKQGQEIDHLEERHIVFADGSRLEADVIVCATGYQNMKTTAVRILGDTVKDIKEVWGMDEEGEIKTMWRSCGFDDDRLIMMGGNLALVRYMSLRAALRIKAKTLGMY